MKAKTKKFLVRSKPTKATPKEIIKFKNIDEV